MHGALRGVGASAVASILEARIKGYELAARMQLAAGGVLDLKKESEATKKMYGLDNPVTVGISSISVPL